MKNNEHSNQKDTQIAGEKTLSDFVNGVEAGTMYLEDLPSDLVDRLNKIFLPQLPPHVLSALQQLPQSDVPKSGDFLDGYIAGVDDTVKRRVKKDTVQDSQPTQNDSVNNAREAVADKIDALKTRDVTGHLSDAI